jgi:hypothetical protein
MLNVVMLNVVARAKAKAGQVKIGKSINNSGEKGFSHFVVKTMTPRARTVKLFTVVKVAQHCSKLACLSQSATPTTTI